MTEADTQLDLTGSILIAMPGMGDPRFDKSVVYMCAHSPDGAMGLIVNKPTEDVRLSHLLEQLDIRVADQVPDKPVHFGGPVEHGRGFVLHSRDYQSDISTLIVDEEIAMTATLDILEDLARGFGPSRSIMALGYAGWGPGQLEGEIGQNGWLTSASDPALVFDADDGSKWEKALKRLGIDALVLSASAGHA